MPKRKESSKFLKVSVSSRIDPALQKKIAQLAKKDGLTVSQLIEVALTTYADQR